MKQLSEETIAKMRTVIAAVLAEPKYFDQMHFPSLGSSCSTPSCGVAWVVWCESPAVYRERLKDTRGKEWVSLANKILGVNTGYKLFFDPILWSMDFANAYYDSRTARGRAKAMAARWEHFIATDGRE